ncbi:uncharacterized protein LOC141618927 [Silene latifolia]|uniref:uncharacterized protein LOC141618927 n=1 Tax=Silene latifolia TaxID=37657 RepID=UPI003D77B60E
MHNISSSMLESCSVTTNSRYHKGGRVWMLWKPSLFDVQVQAHDAQFIHASVTSRITQLHFYMTIIYAFNDGKDRKDLWQKLEHIQTQCQGPWAWAGDLTLFLINQEWGTQFHDMTAHFHPAGLFDHSPCIQEIRGHKTFSVVKKLKALKPVMKGINKECFSGIENATEMAEEELYDVQMHLGQDPQNPDLIQKELSLSESLRSLVEARDSFLLQKAKIRWKRCNKNKVIQIEDQEGNICHDSQGIQTAFLEYYQNLLGSHKDTEMVREPVINTRNCYTQAHVDILNSPVTKHEIKQIFFNTPIDKSPGPDGFTCGFFKDSWEVVGDDICAAIKDFFHTDDLLKFCKGNAHSIMLLIRAFSSFSKASGLVMNNTKLEVYFNGVAQELKNDIQQVTGFVKGSMPFRYLGVPIQAGKLNKKECNILTEKMVNRIRSLGAKKLSYAGRIVLINSVLNTLYSYWAGIFPIPKAVVKRIEAICRNFLWDRSSNYHRVPLVSWDTVTLPKEGGDLGIKRAENWNVAIVAKLVDWIYGKADRLWIRWNNQIYLKNGD